MIIPSSSNCFRTADITRYGTPFSTFCAAEEGCQNRTSFIASVFAPSPVNLNSSSSAASDLLYKLYVSRKYICKRKKKEDGTLLSQPSFAVSRYEKSVRLYLPSSRVCTSASAVSPERCIGSPDCCGSLGEDEIGVSPERSACAYSQSQSKESHSHNKKEALSDRFFWAFSSR